MLGPVARRTGEASAPGGAVDPNQFASFDSIQDDAKSMYRMALGWATRVTWIVSMLFWATVLTGGAALVFGLLALDGAWRLVWLVLGGSAIAFGVGVSFRLRSGVHAIINNAKDLQASLVGLLGSLTDETPMHELATSDTAGFIAGAKKARTFRKVAKDSLSKYQDVANAVSTIASFPVIAVTAIGFTLFFGFLAMVFGAALLI